MLDSGRTFTPTEAAVASGVPVKTIHREIDEGPLKSALKQPGNKRCIREEDLLYLAVTRRLDPKLVQLTSQGKDRLHDAIVSYGYRRGQKSAGFLCLAGSRWTSRTSSRKSGRN
jgi:hypothetical protein